MFRGKKKVSQQQPSLEMFRRVSEVLMKYKTRFRTNSIDFSYVSEPFGNLIVKA